MYPIFRYLGFGLGNSDYSTGFRQVDDYWVLGPLGYRERRSCYWKVEMQMEKLAL